MTNKGRGLKPNKGWQNTENFENSSHIGPSFAGRKSKKTRTHHTRTIHLDSGNSDSGVTQPKKGKKEANDDRKVQFSISQPSSNRSGLNGGNNGWSWRPCRGDWRELGKWRAVHFWIFNSELRSECTNEEYFTFSSSILSW